MICNVGEQNIDISQSFSAYIEACQTLISQKREDLTNDPQIKQQIIHANSPFEVTASNHSAPKQVYKTGIMLIHGLFDSPFSMREIAAKLCNEDTLCRAILLPGHGTHPRELLTTSYHEWLNTLAWSIEQLKQQVEQVYIIGYSTGATLAVYHALNNSPPQGIIMLAPAFRIKRPLDKLLSCKFINHHFSTLKPWLRKDKELDYIRYSSIASNPVIQLNRLIHRINTSNNTLRCPIMMINSLDDEVICPHGAMDYFNRQTHPQNKMLLYGNTQLNQDNIMIRPARYPELNIESISHVSIPYSIDNLHYGAKGDYIKASKVFNEQYQYGAYNKYEQFIFKNKQDLTFNPDFDFMIKQIREFIESVA